MTVDALAVASLPIAEDTRAFLARPLGNVIDGEVVPSLGGATLAVIDPGTGVQVHEVPDSNRADVDAAVSSARASFADGRWRKLPPFEKEARLRRYAQLVGASSTLLGEIDMVDNGMPRAIAGYHTMLQAEVLNYYAGWPSKIEGRVHATPEDIVATSKTVPIGVCLAIVPWNGPATSALWKIAPALACGNSVILKPAEQTPMSAILLAQLALEAGIPPGVVNVVQGRGAGAGAALVEHHGIDKISFTGSTITGRAIAASAAARLKKVTLELGGKGANIVFADADLDRAAQGSLAAIWANSGQICIAGSRLLVERPVHDEFVDRLASMSQFVKVGNGFDPETTMGPVVSRQQLERVLGYISLGKQEGASLVLGSERTGDRGYFVNPTIFTGVHNDMRIAREEIFGPVLSIIPFDTEEEAVGIANDTDYGLGAGLWTGDVSRASRVADELEAGSIWVNTYADLFSNVPFGGIKQSGLGKELGEGGIDAFTEVRTTYLRRR